MEHQLKNQCSRLGGANPPVRLHLQARKVGAGIEWSLDFKNPPAQGSKARVELPRRSGDHDIVIRLIPTQGLNITFDTADPIWVREGSQCPCSKGIKTDQIDDVECSDRELRIHDLNEGKARTLTYRLNFIGSEPLDPAIRNGGTV